MRLLVERRGADGATIAPPKPYMELKAPYAASKFLPLPTMVGSLGCGCFDSVVDDMSLDASEVSVVVDAENSDLRVKNRIVRV